MGKRLRWLALIAALMAAIGGIVAHQRSVAAASVIPPDVDPPYTVQKNITFCTMGGTPLQADVYSPLAKTATMPLVLFIHGGGWHAGKKEHVLAAENRPTLHALVSHGYVVASINYRLAPGSRFPAMIEDAKCAVRYFRANAKPYSIDPNRIAAWGGSAGAHLALLLGLTGQGSGWDVGPYAGVSSRVQAVVDWYGPTDLPSSELTPKRLLGSWFVFGTFDKATLLKDSPISYVAAGGAPTLIVQGEQDPRVPPSQSQALYSKLQAAHVPSALILVQNAGHGFVPTPSGATIDPSLDQIAARVLSFLDKELVAATAVPS